MKGNVARAPGQYCDVLRMVGRVLDERQALLRSEAAAPQKPPVPDRSLIHDLEIIEHEVFMAVSWQTGAGSVHKQAYSELVLSELREEALTLRGETTAGRPGEYEELLRALGQELDTEQIQLSGIFEKDEEFLVTGGSHGRYFSEAYSKVDLRRLSEQRRALRRPPPVEVPAPEAEVALTARHRRWRF